MIALGGAVATGVALAFVSGGLLLGLAAARHGLHHRMATPNRAGWAAVPARAVVVAVPLLGIQVDTIEHGGFDRVSSTAGLVVAVGYASALVVLTASRVGRGCRPCSPRSAATATTPSPPPRRRARSS
ncbi:hypothetical protein WHI96_02435 [Pseudonocardia tropica]|uniref:Uncharacterized protein n=1 Tax=Pseudonocardia tropica TaxID=681289 RepID=A0ABV1JNZ4_9PSEU